MSDRTRAVVLLTLVAALLWHGMAITSAVGTRGTVGRDLATPYYAAKVALADADPYARTALSKAAQADRTRSSVPPLRTPPPSIALGLSAWALPLEIAWQRMIALQELALAGALLLLARWWRPLGPVAPTAAVAVVAVAAPVALAIEAARGHVILLALAIAAGLLDARERRVPAGIVLGVGAALDPRLAVLAVPWTMQARWQNVLAGLVTFVAAHAAIAPLVGWDGIGRYWTEVAPALLRGDWSGTGAPVSSVENHAIVGAFGIAGQVVPPALAVGQLAVGGLVLAGLATTFRRPSADPLVGAARVGAVLVVALLMATYTRDPDLVLALPAAWTAIAGVLHGRLSARWAVGVGLAVAILAYPTQPIEAFVRSVLQPSAPALAGVVAELGTAALVVLLAACARIGAAPTR